MSAHQRPIRLMLGLGLFVLAACGTDTEASTAGVATLAIDEATDAGDDRGAGNEIETAAGADVDSLGDSDNGSEVSGTTATAATAEEAALDFAACMRDAGVDFPDPTVDADGNPTFERAANAAGAGGVNPRSEEFVAGREACQTLTEGFTFGQGARDGVDRTELQDALLPFTDCLRDEGLDVGDFTIGGGQGAGVDGNQGNAGNGADGDGDGDAGAGAGARGQRGGGDPSARIAAILGLDTEDPTTAAALEVCAPLLESAFSNFGPNAQQNDNETQGDA